MPKEPSKAVNVATPLKTNGDIDWNAIKPYVLDTIHNQNAPNTARGILYILETKQILKKTDYSYNRLDSLLVDWRKAGDIPWNAIADGSGRGVVNDFGDYKSPSKWVDSYIDVLKKGGENYRVLLTTEWRWKGQPHYVEFLTEKNTVTSTIAAHTQDLYVKVSFNRGDSGWRFMYDNCVRWKQELRNGKMVHIRYLGDWDTKGRDMDRQIRVQLKHFGLLSRIDFKRIGVIPEQIQEYNIPLNYDKKRQPSYEIDGLNALNETAFRDLLRSNVEPYFERGIYEEMLLQKEHTIKYINRLVRDKITFKR